MTQYLKASSDDKQEIIDLIDYVFSHEYTPHDFKKMLPKVYSDEVDGLGAEHYIARENGSIRAVVATRIVDMVLYGKRLKTGFIGSVAVHPESRGAGYMKILMNYAEEDAKRLGVQLLLLSGKRQRYGFFGFENAGILYQFHVSSANVRHALAEIDASLISSRPLTGDPEEVRFVWELNNRKPCHAERNEDELLRIMSSWTEPCSVVCKNGCPIGYCYGSFKELVLEDEADFPAVLKALFPTDKDSVYIPVASHERKRIEYLSSICEDYNLRHNEKVCVLDWNAVLSTLLSLKAEYTPLRNGNKRFMIDDRYCFSVSVRNGRVSVKDAKPNRKTVKLEHNDAERLFFELDGLLAGRERYGNWFPLPFYIDAADTF